MVSLPIEERLAFQGSVLRLLAERSTEADVRRVMETDAGYDPDVWKALAEIGAVGLLVDPEYGGAGAGPLELELVMEAVGAALLCSPAACWRRACFRRLEMRRPMRACCPGSLTAHASLPPP